jgi:exonuclease III
MRSLTSVELISDSVKPLLRTMNANQEKVFYHIRNWCLESAQGKNPEPFYIHLTGGAGTGKSHLIKCLYYEANKILRNREKPNETTVLLTAPTGTAAFGVGGYTIASALKIPRKLSRNYEHLAQKTLETLQNQLGGLKILIIDECSMVGRKLLSYIHGRLKQIKKFPATDRNAWFGRACILAVGDFYQLPPVKATSLCIPDSSEGVDLWYDFFKIVRLEEIMRQKDDVSFAEMLNRLRVKKKTDELSEEDHAALSSRANLPDIPDKALHIFAKNKDVKLHNFQMFEKYCRNPRIVQAQDYIKQPQNGRYKKSEHTRTGANEDLEDALHIDEGARVMMTRNVETSDGLVNGAFGTVAAIENHKDQDEVNHVYVKFDSERVGKNQKPHNVPHVHKDAVAIDRYEDQMAQVATVKRRQFPLKLAYACTSHKVQGFSLKQCVFDMTGIFMYGQSYVALSRVTSRDGLYLKNYDPSLIYCDERITKYLNNMEELEVVHSLNHETHPNTLTLVHHNVQGLKSKLLDIRSNRNILTNDIIMATETWLTDTIADTDVAIENYTMYRRDRANNDGRGGVVLYMHKNLKGTELQIPITSIIEYVAVLISKEGFQDCLCVAMYRPPSQKNSQEFDTSLRELLQYIDSHCTECKNVIVAGDFNENLLSEASKPIMTAFDEFKYQQKVSDATTRYGSLLDAVYVRTNKEITASVLPTYYSDHEAIAMKLV